jgi:glycosyltransferase involved in cell wall biosynthesis
VSAQPEISVIVPFYNEEESIRRMHSAIVDAVAPLGISFEMVFVNDGSRDRTLEIATDIARADERVMVVNFRRNYGQTPAMAAGIEQAHGRILVTMDGDLQNDPRDIEHFLAKIGEGYDIVVGWRHDRQDKLVSRKIPSQIANWIIGKVTGVAIKDNGCSLKAYRADLIKAIPLYSEMHRFIPAVASIAGPRIAEIKVRHHARQFGQSKYGLSRIYKVLLDLMVIKTVASFTARPLLWFAMLATPLALIGLLLLGYSLSYWTTQSHHMPLPLAGSALLFLYGSLILGLGGVIGEFVYELGDMRESDFSRLSARTWATVVGAPAKEFVDHA